jgi:hypothetical protein
MGLGRKEGKHAHTCKLGVSIRKGAVLSHRMTIGCSPAYGADHHVLHAHKDPGKSSLGLAFMQAILLHSSSCAFTLLEFSNSCYI